VAKCFNKNCEYLKIHKDRRHNPNPHGSRAKGKSKTIPFKGKGRCILGQIKRKGLCGGKNAG